MEQQEPWNSHALNQWLLDTFLNTSGAPRNDKSWFDQCIRTTIIEEIEKTGKIPVVGLCGRAGSGKDSALGYFVTKSTPEEHMVNEFFCSNMFCIHTAFAEALKDIAKIFGFTQAQLTDRKLKEEPDTFWGISPRKFLQMAGTEMFRKVWREDVWVKVLEKKIEDIRSTASKPSIIFVTDVRFPNEAEAIKRLGGIVIRVKRPNNPLAIDATHDSERFVESMEVDAEISNDCKNATEWSWKFAKQLIQTFKPGAFWR